MDQKDAKSQYCRVCPDCGKEIVYLHYTSYYNAVHRQSTCRSCRTRKANKSPTRDNSKENNGQWKGYKEIPYSWFSSYFERNHKHTGNISIEDVHSLWITQNKRCALSGVAIGFHDDCNGYHTASIDRIDSLGNYTLDNIQLVHKDINLMKNRFKQEYFVTMCKLVASTN